MRILNHISSFRASAGGPTRCLVDISEALARRGHTVTVATPEADDASPPWSHSREGSPRLAILPRPGLPSCTYGRSALKALEELIQAHDIVSLHGMWEYGNIQAARIAQRCGKPYVVDVHGMLDEWAMTQHPLRKRLYLHLLGTRWLARAAGIRLTARLELEQAARWLPPGRGRVIWNLVDIDSFAGTPGGALPPCTLLPQSCPPPRILFLSRLHWQKGLDTLLRSVAILRRRGLEVSLVVAGDGESRYVASQKMLAASLGLSPEHTVFVGHVTGTTKLSLYHACQVFALPTHQESFGMALVEALASGLPVVTSRNIDLRFELEQCPAVSCVARTPGAFADALATMLKRVVSDPMLPDRTREWAHRTFDPSATVAAYEAFYAEAIAQSRKTHGNDGKPQR